MVTDPTKIVQIRRRWCPVRARGLSRLILPVGAIGARMPGSDAGIPRIEVEAIVSGNP